MAGNVFNRHSPPFGFYIFKSTNLLDISLQQYKFIVSISMTPTYQLVNSCPMTTTCYLKSMTSAFGKSFWLKENLLSGWFFASKLDIEIVVQSLPCLIFTAEGL